jgi:dihydroorotase
MKILIKNGRVIDPASGHDAMADVAITAGKIVAVGHAPVDFVANTTIDAQGCLVLPGLVDLNASLGEPGGEHTGRLASELKAAVAGGITTVVCPPDTDPVLDEPGLVDMLTRRARAQGLAQVLPLGALTRNLDGTAITEMVELNEAGCIAFSNAYAPIVDTQVLQRAMQYAASFNLPVWLTPADAHLSRGGVAASGPMATRLGLSGVSVAAETIALFTIFELMRATACRVHLHAISSAAGLDLIARAKAEGLPVTCDVTANHIHLCDVDIGYFDSNYHVQPPLRSTRDRAAIRAALKSGVVDAICSQHTTLQAEDKLLPFADSAAGASGLELLLPLVLKWAEEEKIPLLQALALVTSQPAKIAIFAAEVPKTSRAVSAQAKNNQNQAHVANLALANLKSVNLKVPVLHSLAVGQTAHCVVVDAAAHWQVKGKNLISQSKNTPFEGYELCGQVRHTLVAGQVVYSRVKT